MATVNFDTVEDSKGVYYSENYHLEEIRLFATNGESIDLRKILRELSINEDIFSFSVSGYVKVEDALGLIEAFKLAGNEYIRIVYGKSADDPDKHEKTYKVYKLADRNNSGNFMSEYYTLYFCSDELTLSEQTKISKSYMGYQVNDIIYDILTEQLEIPTERISTIEDTIGTYDFVVPRLKPFEAISWLSNYARPAEGIGADMLFFETKNGYNFRSLQSMFKDTTYRDFKYERKNLNDVEQPLEEKMKVIISFEFPKAYDVLQGINSGAFANKLISLDPIQRKKTQTTFNYNKYNADTDTTSLNGNSIINNLKNRFGKELYTGYDGSLKLATGNSNQEKNEYLSDTNSDTKDIYVETFIPNRTAQIALSMLTTIKIVVPGFPGLMVGQVVEISLPSIQNNGELDINYSGKYLVTAARHIIQPSISTYQTILELAKDSGTESATYVDNNNDSNLQKLVDGMKEVWI